MNRLSLPNERALAVPVPAGEVLAVAHEYAEAGRLDAAERLLGHVLAADPGQATALHMRGMIALKRKRYGEASGLVQAAIAAGGDLPVLWRDLAETLRLQARMEEALVAARRALALDPSDPVSLFVAALVQYDRAEAEPCIAMARAALALRPDFAPAHMKLAQALLLSGRFAEGWEHYEWRFRIPGAVPPIPGGPHPQWDGAAMAGRLLLIADQGYGDVVMFARYIPWVLARCPDTVLAGSSDIVGLVTRMHPGLRCVSRWEEAGVFAVQCPLSGLPRLHGTQADAVPWPGPYLPPDPALMAQWRARLDACVPAGALRVGLAWAGRPTHNNDANRTMKLAELAPLASISGVAFVSLQKGEAAGETAGWPGPAPLIDLAAEFGDFLETASVIAGLDLVVAVDTAVVHVAGAMGCPAWVMLPFAPDWRWQTARADSPWYPSLRLFRPPAPRAWAAVVDEVVVALRALTGV